ncbi:hypothetical protein Pan241w_38100 [Gimesia alba]|uniref:Uncharacterized protein n=1 Tax=Gimesia alba TaxID=2527973 RepID=A0A517RIK6_9PLAN|nr:hypothetical protein [Gimesia alba]QDT43708.1 hypothetical protein Pan241w_38100 [Gimesia alba]
MNDNNRKTSELGQTEDVSRTFRPRKHYRNQGIGFLLFFVTVGIASVYAMWVDTPPDRRMYLMVFVGLFWSFWAGGSLWMLLAYKYESLTIREETVIQQGVLFSKELDLSRIKQVRWKLIQGGGITLLSLTDKMKIYLDNFEREERLWLIHYFQHRLSESVQEGWELFCHRIAVPLQEYNPDVVQTPAPDEVLLTRKRWDWYLIPTILIFTVGATLATWKFQLPNLLVGPVIPLVLWLMLRYSTPKRGMVSKRISSQTYLKSMLIFEAWWLSVGLIGYGLFQLIVLPAPWNLVAGYSLAGAWFLGLLWKAHRVDCLKNKQDQTDVKLSLQKWEVDSGGSD